MTNGTRQDALVAFEILVNHFAGKQAELRLALQLGRGFEGWFQHEAIVALDTAYWGGVSGKLAHFGRERKSERSELGSRRPFDVWFKEPKFVAAIKVYPLWKTETDALGAVRADLNALADEPGLGMFLLGRLWYLDEKGEGGGRKVGNGEDWCRDLIQEAGQGLTLVPLAPSRTKGDGLVSIRIAPRPQWIGEDAEAPVRFPAFTMGAWCVRRSKR